MTIDEWAAAHKGTSWRVDMMRLTVADVIAVHGRLNGPTMMQDAAIALFQHPDVIWMQSSFGLGARAAEKLTGKALRLLVRDRVIAPPKTVRVWHE